MMQLLRRAWHGEEVASSLSPGRLMAGDWMGEV
jgi:hypothetical protein